MKPGACGLRPVPNNSGRTMYCGPSAIAAITGHSPEEVERVILQLRGEGGHGPRRERRRAPGTFKSVWSSEVPNVAKAVGYRAYCVVFPKCHHSMRITFSAWRLRGRIGCYDDAHLVLVTCHFVAVKGDWFVDTNNRTPILASAWRGQRKRIQQAWKFVRVAE